MGSFNLACSISGLPCTPGDAVHVLLVAKNHDDGGFDVYTNASWTPRTPALRATYDDYGAVALSDAPEERVLQSLTRQMLDLEAVEGASGCDAPVRRGMSLDDYLDAIRDDVLAVSCESQRLAREANARWRESRDSVRDEPVITPIPTVASVVAVLERSGLRANDPHAPCFAVDEYETGEITVSCRLMGELRIEQAKSTVESDGTYACVLARGRRHEGTVLRIFPAPNAEGWVGPCDVDEDARQVKMVLVRSDVWEGLLALPIPSWRSTWKEGISLGHYVTEEAALREKWMGFARPAPGRRGFLFEEIDKFLCERKGGPSLLAGHLGPSSFAGGSGSPSITGWSDHYQRWIDALVTDDEGVLSTADQVGRRFAESCMVYDHMSIRSMRLMPSQYAGQGENWRAHGALHELVRKIAEVKADGVEDD